MSLLLTLTVPAEASRLKALRDAARAALSNAGIDEPLSERLVLALGEACMNIIQHGYGGDDDRRGEINLEIRNNQGELRFRLRDDAPTVDPNTLKSRDLEEIRPGGLGLRFMQELMDHVEYLPPPEGRGNLLEMRKRIGPRTNANGHG